MAPRDLHSTWARLFLQSLADAGARDVVSSPGARSTPLLVAALAHPDLTVHSIIDERSAAFFAVGRAKVTGRAPLLVCTSGTAGAHYYPALVEASEAGVPVIAITADRPRELQNVRAPQTTDQANFFGGFARAFFDLGMPDEHEDALRALRRSAAHAWMRAHAAKPGPVQINAPFRKPLEPREPNEDDARVRAAADAIACEPIARATPPEAWPQPDAIEHLAGLVAGAKRGVIACGPAPLMTRHARGALAGLANGLGFPLLAESTSQFRFANESNDTRVDFFDTALRAPRFRERAAPDLVITIGGTMTSSAWSSYRKRHPDVRHVVLTEHDWTDATNRATDLVFGPIPATLGALAAALDGPRAADPEWLTSWKRADDHVRTVLDRRFADTGSNPDAPLTEGVLTRELVRSLPEGSLLALGNSLPVRDVDWFAPGDAGDIAVWSQRGVNGIDGLVSGAAGAASAWPGRTTLYVGDVSLLHDLHGILVAAGAPKPLTIVVPLNGGGRIFDLLPLARNEAIPQEALAWWTTPRTPDFEGLARSAGASCVSVETAGPLRTSLADSHERPGCTIILAGIAPHTVTAEQEEIRADAIRAIDRDFA